MMTLISTVIIVSSIMTFLGMVALYSSSKKDSGFRYNDTKLSKITKPSILIKLLPASTIILALSIVTYQSSSNEIKQDFYGDKTEEYHVIDVSSVKTLYGDTVINILTLGDDSAIEKQAFNLKATKKNVKFYEVDNEDKQTAVVHSYTKMSSRKVTDINFLRYNLYHKDGESRIVNYNKIKSIDFYLMRDLAIKSQDEIY